MRTPILFAAGLAALWALVVFAAPQTDEAIDNAVAFIQDSQEPDGGFGGFGAGQTYDAVLALRAAGLNPAQVTTDGNSPADFLEAQAATIAAENPALAAKAALAARALELDPTSVAGTDLVAAVEGAFDQESGRYAEDDFSHASAILGLACTENDVPAAATDALRDTQVDNGGWGFQGMSDPDTTAIVVQAMLAAGLPATDPDIAEALTYLRDTQGDDGGWGIEGEPSNAASTAYVVQALIAAGEDVTSSEFLRDGQGPIDLLLSQQLPDGSFEGFDPVYAAIQVVPALAGRTLCDAADTAITTAAEQQPATSEETPATESSAGAPEAGTGTSSGSDALPWLLVAGGVVLVIGAFGLTRLRR